MLKTRESLMETLTKYLGYVALDLKEAFMYRFNLIIWILIDIIVPFMMIFVWIAVFKETDQVENYNVNSMVTYYLVANLCFMATTPNVEWAFLNHIKRGDLSATLLRPVDFFWRCIFGETMFHSIRLMMFLPFLLGMIAIFHQYITLPGISFLKIGLFMVAILTSYLLSCGLKLILGTMAFWFVDCWGIFATYRVLMSILSGALIPISLLPGSLRIIADILPFKMLVSFPVSYILGNITNQEYFQLIGVQVIWMVGVIVMARLLWRAGLKKYEAVGG